VVVRSATVTATQVSATAEHGVRVEQVASRGTPTPRLLVSGELKAMLTSGAAQLLTPSVGDVTVTLVY
jgi:hypothetical protein